MNLINLDDHQNTNNLDNNNMRSLPNTLSPSDAIYKYYYDKESNNLMKSCEKILNKVPQIDNSKIKKKVKFKENFVEIIFVEKYKCGFSSRRPSQNSYQFVDEELVKSIAEVEFKNRSTGWCMMI